LGSLNDALAEEKESISTLTDTVNGEEQEKKSTKDDIEVVQASIFKKQLSASKAKTASEAETTLYDKNAKALAGSIKAVTDALTAVSGAASQSETALLLQREDVQAMLSLIQADATEDGDDAAEAAQAPLKAKGDVNKHVKVYNSKSDKVVQLLKDLKAEFIQDKQKLDMAQQNALNNYALAKTSQTAATLADTTSKKDSQDDLASTKKSLATDTGKLRGAKNDNSADTARKATVSEKCSIGKIEFATRAKTRSLELAALDAAVGILGKVTGVRTTKPGNPMPPVSPMDFLQLGQIHDHETLSANDPKMKAVTLLRKAARETHSNAMTRLSVEVAANLKGPFNKVNGMIQSMIFRLKGEQTSEDEHKHWCDLELKKTSVMKDENQDDVDAAVADIKVENAAVATLTAAITSAQTKVGEITSFMKEATEIRNTGKAENKLAIKDAQEAQKAITNAISVLQDFYKGTGAVKKEDWELLQEDADANAPVNLPKDPALWDSPYTGANSKTNQPAGILAILKNVAADFVRMEGETEGQEVVDQKEFAKDMSENKIEKVRRSKEVEMKTAEKASRVGRTSTLASEQKASETALAKTKQYETDLQGACVTTGSGDSYTKRKAARTKEITAVKNSQKVLADAFKKK